MIEIHSSTLPSVFQIEKVPEFSFKGVQTDTRKSCNGALFVALRGENFDGHDYLKQAQAQGAVAALVEKPQDIAIKQIVVDDSLQAMGQLARYWRRQVNPKLVAITGSNGKTTVKEMLAKILHSQDKTLVTPGNFNNAIGVPLTLFGLSRDDAYAVVEMGANHPREIEYLVGIAEPDVVYVNNARAAHLSGFGSVQGVVEAKGEMYQSAPSDSTAVFNEDEPACDYWKTISNSQRKLSFSMQHKAEINAGFSQQEQGIEVDVQVGSRSGQCSLNVYGSHNASNATAAISLAMACGLELDDCCHALSGFSGVSGRLQMCDGPAQSHIIDDSYNANPDSLAAAIDVLCALEGRAWLALGDMAEMGDESLSMHMQALDYARQQGVEEVFALGAMSCRAAEIFGKNGQCFDTHAAMAGHLMPRLKKGVNLLVKGSRSSGMDKLVTMLTHSSLQTPTQGTHHAV